MPTRKQIRLADYDYSQNGAYFITICTENRRHLFGEVVGAIHESPSGVCRLWSNGKIVEQVILHLQERFPHIQVDRFVIMPNHIHLVLLINQQNEGTSRTPSPTNATIPAFVSTFKRFVNKQFGANCWQRSYHDHIIRDEKDYLKIAEYIENNPKQWEMDCFYTKEEVL